VFTQDLSNGLAACGPHKTTAREGMRKVASRLMPGG
jgi:hypothetical protein